MSIVAPFVSDRFQSTVPFYVAHRPRYPAALIAEVAGRSGLTSVHRVLDLGCGPGFLAVAFAAVCGCEVVGIDPDPAMLAAARHEAASAGVNVRFTEGSSYDLSPAMGVFRFVAMGRSFHWMDRAATLKTLDAMVESGGAVCLFSENHERSRENRWQDVLRKVQHDFVGASSSEQLRSDPNWDSHAAVLLDSAFPLLERIALIERRAGTVEGLVGRSLSMSMTSPQALGDRLADFTATLRARLLELYPSGRLAEIIEFSALMARRSG
ncbi:MAG: methyltransferase domain-containing protein [Methylobacteriaceae bacterium]|nr:methyltransferase domain-containing protein [Methylobacteriaceae bacterium]